MIEASNLTKRYPGGLEAVKDASFRIDGGQMVLITGHSGAGKTTLVKLISTIERPTSGSLVVNGQNLTALRRSALPHVRRHFGLVFQDQKLLFDRNALDNVLLPLQIAGLPHREAVFGAYETYQVPITTIEQLEACHKARGYSSVGYHYYITRDGTLYPCRPQRTPKSQLYDGPCMGPGRPSLQNGGARRIG